VPSTITAIETPRRRAIEEVASSLFRERGYAATSVRDIARALAIQGASLYAHMASKEDVLWAIVDRAARRFEAAAEDALASTDGGPMDRVAAVVRAHVRVITDDVGAASVFVHEWRALGPERRAVVLARRDAYEARFRDVIADGMATGDFHATDPALAARFILNGLNGLSTWYDPDGRLSADRIADQFADFALRTLTGEAC
jgi:AcrR family transcriptional regulator